MKLLVMLFDGCKEKQVPILGCLLFQINVEIWDSLEKYWYHTRIFTTILLKTEGRDILLVKSFERNKVQYVNFFGSLSLDWILGMV